MKLAILLFFVLATAIFSNPLDFSQAENERNAKIILENSRDNFKCGWPDIGDGIAPIDPFFLSQFNISQRSNGMNVTSAMSNVRLFGLKSFRIDEFTLHPDRRIEYVFTVPQLFMNGTHTTRGTMIGISLVNGNGPMVSHMTNSRYHGVVTWSTLPGTDLMYVKYQTMDVTIQSMNMTLSGFGVLTNAVNNQINEQIPEMIASDEFQQQMNDLFDTFIIPIFDSFMNGQTQATIGDVLAYRASNPLPPQC